MLKFVFASVVIVPIAFGQIVLTTAQIAKMVSPSWRAPRKLCQPKLEFSSFEKENEA